MRLSAAAASRYLVICLLVSSYATAGDVSPDALWQQHMAAATRALSQQDLPAAIDAYSRALDLAKSFAATDPRRIRNLEELASVTHRRGLPQEALALYGEALELRLGSSEGAAARTAVAMAQQARILQPLEQYDRAEALLRQALEIQENAALAGQLASLLQVSRPDDAEIETYLQRAVTLDPSLASPMNLARFYSSRGLHEQAIDAYGQALARAREPELPNHWTLTEILTNLAEENLALERRSEAESLYLQALDLQQRGLGAEHTYVAETLRRLGSLYIAEGRYIEAERQLERAQTLKTRAWGSCDACGLEVRKLLLEARRALGRAEEPCSAVEPVIGQAADKSRDELKAQGEKLYEQALNLRNRGELVRAIDTHRQALRLVEDIYGSDSLELSAALASLARLLAEQQSAREAAEVYEQSLRILEMHAEADPSRTAEILHGLATAFERQRRHQDAERNYRRELEIREALGQNLVVATLLETLGRTSRAQGDERAAGDYFLAAAERRRETLGEQAPEVVSNLAALSMSYLELGLVEDAQRLLFDLRARQESRQDTDPDTYLTVMHALKKLFDKTGKVDQAAATQAGIDRLLRLKEPPGSRR